MNLKETIQLINEIEQEFPVHRLRYKGVAIWPMIRLTHTYYKVIEKRHNGQKEEGNLGNYFGKSHTKSNNLSNLLQNGLLSQTLLNWKDRQASSKRVKTLKDVVFVLKYEDRNQVIDNRHFSRIIDSMAYFADKDATHTLEYTLTAPPKMPRYSSSQVITRSIAWDFLWSELKTKFNPKPTPIEYLEEYTQFLAQKNIIAHTNPNYLRRYFDHILTFRKRFSKVLKKIKPKVVFLSCFYTSLQYGLILACKDLGIKTVDVQHGQQGDFHLMYTHWANIPAEGYALLPSHFWTWGAASAKRIQRWTDKTSQHQVIMGGNPWSTFCRENEIGASLTDKKTFQELVADKKEVILLSLQLIQDFKASCLIEAMKVADSERLWLIRLHPLFRKFIPDIQQFLIENGCKNFELQLANDLPIYYLFKHITHQVTFWSTVAYEALSFDVPTIIIHPNGYDAMRSYIEKGIFKYTENAKQLLQYIQDNEFEPEGKEKYILNDPELIRKNIRQLLIN